MSDVLKNPHRRKILELLSTRKVATPREISEELGIGVPTVYYHLELMKGYVQKTARGEFAATEKGLELYKATLKEGISQKAPMGQLVPYRFFSALASSPRRFLLLSAAIGAVEYAFCHFLLFRPYLMSYARSIDLQSLPLYYLANIAALFLLLEASSFLATRRLGGELPLINGIMLSRLPLMIIAVDPLLGNLQPLSLAAVALGQLASVYALSMSLSLSKGIRQETALIICLVILYLNIFFYL
ncbi:MAG TPA: winged helix-turn-helix domain-containing protein [Candidatus Methanomethylicus sp.]|nr:winged helix-turn-helix domain-containing protein [Candidatus Methanomethylicus sp.]